MMVICTFCGQRMVPLFRARDYRRADDRREWQLNWCAECEFGRLEGEFTPEKVASFYPAAYYTHGEDLQRERHVPFSDRLRAHLAWRLDAGTPLQPREITPPRDGPSSFCDLGCGSGEQLRLFREAGYKVIGVEPDPRARSIAQKADEVLNGTAEHIPPKVAGMRFDLVLLSHVLEHCIDPMMALSNVGKILAADGTLLLEVPNNSALGFSSFGATWPWADIPRHLNFFTERSLHIALQKSGFAVTRVNYVGYTRQFQLEWIRAQERIWAQIGVGSKPNYKWAAWKLLLRTAFASAPVKYDSVRVHAVHLAQA